jgi:hypothetical protein
MRFTPPSNGDEDDAERAARLARIRAEQAEQRWYENKMTLMDVPFTVYAAEGWPARINGSGSSNGNLTRLVIAHAETLTDWMPVRQPQIVVTTSIERHQPGELAIARDAFASELARSEHEQPTEGLSDAALNLWFRASHRRRAARSHEAPVSETEIMIDGAPAPFTTVGTPTAEWVAVRRHDDTTITVIGRAIDPATLSIEPVPDLEARLLGPKPDEP